MNRPRLDEIFLRAAEPGFRLGAPERARVPPTLDVDAVEALLARVRPEHRAALLQSFAEITAQGKVAFGPMISHAGDPEIDALIQRVRPLARHGGSEDHRAQNG